MTEIYYLGGAGDTNFIPNLIRPVIGNRHRLINVPYAGGIGPISTVKDPWADIQKSLREGEFRISEAVRKTNDVPWLVGYSLGAYALSNFIDRWHQGAYLRLEIRGVITVGSPKRPGGGIAGNHANWHKLRSLELTAPDDVISNTPPDSALRRIPYFVDAVTGIGPGRADVVRFMSMIFNDLAVPFWCLSNRDIELCWKYLDGSGHVNDYFKDRVYRNRIASFLR